MVGHTEEGVMKRFLRAVRDILASTGHDINADHSMRRNCCPLNPYNTSVTPARSG